jgi:YesN/AraC family two-component response regulator
MENDDKLDISVLYVEDEDDTRSAIGAQLARRVRTLLIAENGRQGLDAFREYHPDIVVTDIMMPVMDGLTMARDIKSLDSTTQIIVTTAHNDTGYFLDAIDIGIDQYVLKPIDQEKLVAALKKCKTVINREKDVQQHRRERERLITELQDALAKVKVLSGFLPICAYCKKIRTDEGYWTQLEAYISAHSETVFSHGCCPECAKKALAEVEEFNKKNKN